MARVAFRTPRLLSEYDQIGQFDCGVEVINDWLAKHSKRARSLGTAVAYISQLENGAVAGFYTLSMHSLDRAQTGDWLSRNSPQKIPAVKLGMLAVDKTYQGQGLGEDLLQNALRKAYDAARPIGVKAITVEPYDDSVRTFYLKRGFKEVPGSKSLYARLF